MKCKQYLKPTSTQAQTFSIFNEFEHLNIRKFRFVWLNTFSRVNAFFFSISEEIIRCNENRPHTKFQLKLFEWNRQPSDSCMPTNFNHFHHFSPTKTFLIRNIYTVQRYIHEDEQVMKVGCSLWFFFPGKDPRQSHAYRLWFATINSNLSLFGTSFFCWFHHLVKISVHWEKR